MALKRVALLNCLPYLDFELGPFNWPTKQELNHPRRLESQIAGENRELSSIIAKQHVALHTLVNLANMAQKYFQYHLDLKLSQSFHTGYSF